MKRACSFSLRADGLNQASRSAVGKGEGMYSIAMTIAFAGSRVVLASFHVYVDVLEGKGKDRT